MKLLPWIMAARPRTLTLSITPVAVGTALAWAVERKAHWPAVAAALVGAMCIQLGTNLHNDMADSQRGGDGPDRIGPPRVTASGLLSAESVNRGAIACFAMAALAGSYLVLVGGWPILVLGSGRRHLLALHRGSHRGGHRSGSRRGLDHRRCPTGQQSPRRRSRCASGAQDIGDRGGAQGDDRDICGTDVAPFRAAALDR